MIEPTSNPTTYAKILAAIKDFPLWLLTAVALSLIALLLLPLFKEALLPAVRPWIVFLAIFFTILAVCRFVSILIPYLIAKSAARKTFHFTPVSQQAHWNTTLQRDGTTTTHISATLMAKNRTDRLLCLLTVRLIKPRIKGKIISETLLMRSVTSNIYGTAMSGYFVPAQDTLPVTITIIIRGTPKQKTGTISAILAIADEEGNQQKVKLHLNEINPQKK